jgi:hypothetical protein
MRLKFVGLAMVAAWVCSGPPVFAQERAAASLENQELQTTGFRVEEKPDGFQLVTHGVWNAPASEQAVAMAPSIGPNPFYATKPIRGSAKQATSFRRAVYLPHVYALRHSFSHLQDCSTRSSGLIAV